QIVTTMKGFVILFNILPLSFLKANGGNVCGLSDFRLHGDYILGGLFKVHVDRKFNHVHSKPEAVQCREFDFSASGYQELQVMRFAVEEINNSTSLLPNISLGYEIYDYCSDFLNFMVAFDFLSTNFTGSLYVTKYFKDYQPKVTALIGPFGSTENIILSPVFMAYLLPVISHGASSILLSDKQRYPSFLRTIPSDRNQVRAILQILHRFGWRWIALIGGNDDYSRNGLQALKEEMSPYDICVAYESTIPTEGPAMGSLFSNITILKINVVIVFASKVSAVPFIKAAISNKISDKVWIASETWSLNQQLLQDTQIHTIGTVIGITIKVVALPGLREFVHSTMTRGWNGTCVNSPHIGTWETCNQVCSECSSTDPQSIADEDPMYSFSIYSAVYAVAHSLHQFLGCDAEGCRKSGTIIPYQLLQTLKNVNFTLNNRTVSFDKNGDPAPNYGIVVWDKTLPLYHREIGSYVSDPSIAFHLDEELIRWHSNGTVPTALCSLECKEGHRRKVSGVHTCCFDCEICPNGTYVNKTDDPYTCQSCEDDEWSDYGSTHCKKRTLEYLHYNEGISIGILLLAGLIFLLSGAIAIVFARHHDTPVVKSAGGKMCFFMLSCLSVCSLSIFCYFGWPQREKCTLRNPVFVVFYTACISCLAVRSFQIVCIFKMAAKLPKAYDFWVKNHGQWLVVATAIVLQILLCGVWIGSQGPRPFNNSALFKDQIIFDCNMGNLYTFVTVIAFVAALSVLCFMFSYMGTDLPKNYNEAKCITFSLLIFFFSWILYLTAYMVYQGKYIAAINAFSVLASLYGILLGYFTPKCYIILFKPEHNTPAHFQNCIQSYTKKISSE
uniref:Taste receptor type 1 member 1-like n=1 Tax=Lepisosteus oculatus TaxID=7918 RepID=W5M3H6_LEPOC